MKSSSYLKACGKVLGTSSEPLLVHSSPRSRHGLHGWPLSHLMRLTRHQSHALETYLRGRLSVDEASCGRGEWLSREFAGLAMAPRLAAQLLDGSHWNKAGLSSCLNSCWAPLDAMAACLIEVVDFEEAWRRWGCGLPIARAEAPRASAIIRGPAQNCLSLSAKIQPRKRTPITQSTINEGQLPT